MIIYLIYLYTNIAEELLNFVVEITDCKQFVLYTLI